MRWLLVLLALACFTGVASAQDSSEYPWHDFAHRATIGARAEQSWWTGRDETQLPGVDKEIGVGIVGSYALVPNLAATGRVIYYVDSRVTSFSVGVNLLLFGGK